MRSRRQVRRLTLPLALGCGSLLVAACGGSTGPADKLATGNWGSDAAVLTVASGAATLRVLGSGSCYGSYVDIPQAIPGGSFDVAATFTQLMGVSPGHVSYAALVSGEAQGANLSLTITVPSTQATLGPFTLTRGVSHDWTPCLYP